ncbi:muscle M-line assembly unc-89-like, partial [Brachionus plicatilis]
MRPKGRKQFDENFGYPVSLNKKTASHKKFTEFQNRRTLSHDNDNLLASSSSSEDLKTMTDEPDIYFANCDFTSSDLQSVGTTTLSLIENQFVEILDSQDPRFYLVRTRPRKDENAKIGWIPACFLEKKSTSIGQVNRRSTREVFNDDLVLASDKQQEAQIKRNYSFAELIDMENRYVRDLQFVIENYLHELSKADCPKLIKEKREFIFLNLEDIFAFHKVLFLTQLLETDGDSERLSKVFVKNRSNFELYIPYALNRQYSESTLNSYEIIRKFFDDINLTNKNTEYWISDYLNRPLDRLAQYRQFLQEQIKYTVRAKQSSLQLQEAYFVFCDIFKKIETRQLIDSIQNLPVELKTNEKLNRFDAFYIIDHENRARDRYLFLFRDHILICRLKPRTTAETIASTSFNQLGSIVSGSASLPNFFKGALVFKSYVPLSAIRSIKLDNFDENDDKLFIEINLDKNVINSSDMLFDQYDTNEGHENLLQNDNQKLVLQSKNPYSKLAFLKSLKDNLICLGYLEQTIDTLNYFQEDLTSTRMSAVGSSPAKKRKILAKKKSHEGSYANEYHESNEASMMVSQIMSNLETIRSDEDAEYDTEEGSLRGFHKIKHLNSGSILSTKSNVQKSMGSSSSNINMNDFYSMDSTNESSYYTANEHDDSRPKLIKALETVNVIEGESAIFECQISGNPKPGVNWYKYETILIDSPDFIHLEESNDTFKLVIRETNLKDNGIYKIVASNRYGQVTSSCTLNVDEDITDQDLTIIDIIDDEMNKSDNTDNDVFEEEYLHISEGSSSPGEDLEPIDQPLWLKKKVTKNQDNDYRLVVGLKPKFLKLFESCKIRENKILSLTCQVVGEPQPNLKWFKNGMELFNNSRTNITYCDNGVSSLTIPHVLLDDAGSYQVSASNQHGISVYLAEIEVESTQQEDNVFEVRKKSVCSVVPHNVFAAEKLSSGQSVARMRVNVKKEDVKVNWFRDQVALVADQKYKMVENGKERILMVDDVQIVDQGEYICQSGKHKVTLYLTINDESRDCSSELYFNDDCGKVSAKFENLSKDMFVREGVASVELKCKVHHPETQVEWFRNGQRIDQNCSKYQAISWQKERILIVKNPTSADNGNYVCQSGDHSIVLNLMVSEREKSVASSCISDEDKHNQNEQPELVYYVTQNAVLNCQVKNTSEPIVWYKDNCRLLNCEQSVNEEKYCCRQEGENRILVIKNVTHHDTGNYSCHTKSNPNDKMHFRMKIKEPRAEFVQELSNTMATSLNDKITFECITRTPRTVNPYKVKWLRDNDQISQQQSPHYQMFNYCKDQNTDGSVLNFNKLVINGPLSPGDQAEYTVFVNDSIKSSACLSIDPAILTFKPEIYVKKPQLIQRFKSDHDDELMFIKELEAFVECDEANNLVLECWTNNYGGEARWYKDGIFICPGPKFEMSSLDGRKHRLIVRNVDQNDEAIYTCMVNDLIKSSSVLSVNKDVPLRIVRGLFDMHVPEHSHGVQLVVGLNKILHSQNYLMRWFVNKQEVTENEEYSIGIENNKAVLSILREILFTLDNNSRVEFKIQELRAGVHHVELESGCTLTVESTQRRFFSKKLDNFIQWDSGVHLDLEARVNFEPSSIQWFKNHTLLSPGQKFTLINDLKNRSFLLRINDCTAKDSGIYTIDLDGLNCSCQVKVVDTPLKFVQKLQDTFFD